MAAVYVPFIRLSGKWLQAAGFSVGARLRITAGCGTLVIYVEGGGTGTYS